MAIKRILIGMMLFGVVISCTMTELPSIANKGTFQLAEDEQRLWNWAKEEQEKFDNSGLLYENPALVAYVNRVAQRLIPKNARGKGVSFEVKIVKNPFLSACAYPNGVIYIHTGMLAKMENEAQLATILAHEITHVINRHPVKGFRHKKDAAAFLTTLHVVAAPAGIYGAGPYYLGALGAMAAVSGYSKEFEREADIEGLSLMVKAGYHPEEAAKLFDHLKREMEEQDITEPFFFGSHPRLQDRKDSYTELLQTNYAGIEGDTGTQRFVEHILPLLLDNALLDLSMGRFSLAEEAIQRFLQHQSQSSRGHYYLGELFRQRDEEGDREKAEKEYRIAIEYSPSYPEPHKGLGLIYFKQNQKKKAEVAFKKYLALSSQPEDKGYIEQYLEDIQAKATEQ